MSKNFEVVLGNRKKLKQKWCKVLLYVLTYVFSINKKSIEVQWLAHAHRKSYEELKIQYFSLTTSTFVSVHAVDEFWLTDFAQFTRISHSHACICITRRCMKWRTVCVLRRRICFGFPFASSTWNASVHASSTVYFPVILNSQFSSEHSNPEHEQNTSCISLICPGSGSKFSPSGVVPALSTCNTSAHASGTGYLLLVFNSQFCSECQDPKHEKGASCCSPSQTGIPIHRLQAFSLISAREKAGCPFLFMLAANYPILPLLIK